MCISKFKQQQHKKIGKIKNKTNDECQNSHKMANQRIENEWKT